MLDFVDDETGTATITLTANDGGCGSTVDSSFLVTVVAQNDAPVGVADSIQVDEGGTVTTTTANATSVLSNDTDMENDPLTATLITGPLYHQGSFSLQSSGTFTYIHDGSETATDSFIYQVSDGISSVQATATITINRVNDCPTVASPTADITVNEDAPDSVITISSIFSDPDLLPTPNTLSYTVTHTNASLATVTLNSATLTIDYIENQTEAVVTITADDNAGCVPQDVFNVTVNAINDAPNTVSDTLVVDEGGTITTTTASNTSLLDNDIDIDGPNPIGMQLVSMPQFGTLAWSGTGTFTYVHDGSETTTDSFVQRF